MARVSLVLAAVVALSAACGAGTATQEPVQETRATPAPPPEARSEVTATVVVPENPVDRSIRRDLSLAIAHDAALKNRDISFIVTNGDVSVTGTVETEDERKKINDLAMNIDGVRSVANGLRVPE